MYKLYNNTSPYTGNMQYTEFSYEPKLVHHIEIVGHPDQKLGHPIQKHGHPIQELGHPYIQKMEI